MAVETIPVLPSRDFDETAGFYARLGFEESARWPHTYLIVRHPVGIELHFFWSKLLSAASNDHGAYVRFDTSSEVEEFHAAWVAVDLAGGEITELRDTDYGLREFALLDQYRNLVKVGGFSVARSST